MSLSEHFALWRAARARCEPLPAQLPSGFSRWRDIDEFRRARSEVQRDWSVAGQFALHEQIQNQFGGQIRAFCAQCERVSSMRFEHAEGGEANWRESLTCDGCSLINRWRMAMHIFRLLDTDRHLGPIYVTEQLTPLFAALKARSATAIGSEYLGPECGGGEIQTKFGQQLRHEDVTALSMPDYSIGTIGCFDVLEHVPDYLPALSEFHRVLEPGGTAIISVPMNLEAYQNECRAVLEADGSIRHLLEPQYHGDPVRAEGVLCFHEFGWELLAQLKEAGFMEAELWTLWAPEFGYLGASQPFFVARKRGVAARVEAHPALVHARASAEGA